MDQPLIIGFDPGGRDWSAVAIMQRMYEAHPRVLVACEVVRDSAMESINRLVNKLSRDCARPRGYSQSHWRKLWRQRTALTLDLRRSEHP